MDEARWSELVEPKLIGISEVFGFLLTFELSCFIVKHAYWLHFWQTPAKNQQ